MEPASESTPSSDASLSKHIVTFLDVLGFTDSMRQAANDPTASQNLLTSYTSALAAALARIDEDDPFIRRRGFTDNVLLAVELMATHPESTLGHTTSKVAEFQLEMVLNGWFVRGGISIGQFYMDDRIVFGDGLLDAYDLESKIARDPRVVLSGGALRLTRHFLSYYADPYHDAPQNGYVLIDSDGVPFINYLYALQGLEASDTEVRRMLADHKGRVEEALHASRQAPRVWSKYQWVAFYHDFFCETWVESPDALKISPLLLRSSPSLIVQSPQDNDSFKGPGDTFGLPEV